MRSIGTVRGYGIPSSSAAARVRRLSFATSSAASEASARATPSRSKDERQGRRAAMEPSIDGISTRARCARTRSSRDLGIGGGIVVIAGKDVVTSRPAGGEGRHGEPWITQVSRFRAMTSSPRRPSVRVATSACRVLPSRINASLDRVRRWPSCDDRASRDTAKRDEASPRQSAEIQPEPWIRRSPSETADFSGFRQPQPPCSRAPSRCVDVIGQSPASPWVALPADRTTPASPMPTSPHETLCRSLLCERCLCSGVRKGSMQARTCRPRIQPLLGLSTREHLRPHESICFEAPNSFTFESTYL